MKTFLTGAVRYRVQQRFFGEPLLVLQVEEIQEYIDENGTEYRHTEWRDARLEDLSVERLGLKP